ncbi:hypothetical protein GCK32_017107 [Trichostrongylus colubriformis]|uniref:Uncharacterized protein n=1 Tax=Trichostrongylus colubriformis TaxID=6319 RepID=A0AAN8IHB9_TRICO
MFILKLTAFLCIFVQAIAYSRNEGPIEEDLINFGVDFYSWLVLGYEVNQIQSMKLQDKYEKLFKNNAVLSEYKKRIVDNPGKSTEERLLALSIYYILAQVGFNEMTGREGMAQLKEILEKSSKDTREDWMKEMEKFHAERAAGKLKNE